MDVKNQIKQKQKDRHCLSGQGATKQLRGDAIIQFNRQVTDEIICQMAQTILNKSTLFQELKTL